MKKTVPFTLHVRLTKACNADCSYCSSFQENPDRYMSLNDFKESIGFFWNKTQSLGIHINELTIEYVGGEIMLVPFEVLESQVMFARKFFSERNVNLSDGAQTNLLASKNKVLKLRSLFEGRISTSIDSFTDQRTIGGSASKYRLIMSTRETDIKKEEDLSGLVPAVFTIDRNSLPFTLDEVNKARRSNRNLMIRPVFNGGSSIDSIMPIELGETLCETFDLWFMRSKSILDPHLSLLEKRLQTKMGVDPKFERSYCSFQNDCARKSMSLEPNGDLFVCQELGDASSFQLGNAIKKEWNHDTWILLSKRGQNLSSDCLECPYLKDCQGGCMMHSIQDNNGPFGKPSYCTSWKMIFKKIDDAIDKHDLQKILGWIKLIKAD